MARKGDATVVGEDGNNDNEECYDQCYDQCYDSGSERGAAMMMNAMIIFGGPAAGFNTNPETEKRPCFIEIGGEKIVCIAQGGECRYNYKYYSPGLNDIKSWTTPVIDEGCPDRCCYKVLVCDGHDVKCEGSVTYYPRYNKFRGLFVRYCRNLDKYVNQKIGDSENGGNGGKDVMMVSEKDMKIWKINEKGKMDKMEEGESR